MDGQGGSRMLKMLVFPDDKMRMRTHVSLFDFFSLSLLYASALRASEFESSVRTNSQCAHRYCAQI